MFADVSEYMKNSKVYAKYYEDGYLPDDAYNNITFRKDLDGAYIMQLDIDDRDTSLENIPTASTSAACTSRRRSPTRWASIPAQSRPRTSSMTSW
jgi:hypothetical protein